MSEKDKLYLGDSVYVSFDGWMLTLTTENGIGGPSNTIHLDPEVWAALSLYVQQLAKQVNEVDSDSETEEKS